MKLLFEQHLSWRLVERLVERLADLWPESRHTSEWGLASADDAAVWRTARNDGFALVTKDADFCAMSVRFGRPPLVVWLKVPNADLASLARILRESQARLREADADATVGLVEVLAGGRATTQG